MQRFDRSGMTDEQRAAQTTEGLIGLGCLLIVFGIALGIAGQSAAGIAVLAGIVLAALGWRRKDSD